MSMSTRDVQLHLANNAFYYGEVIEMLRYYRDRYDFATALRRFVEDEVFEEDMNALQHELLMTAMADVNWAEIADDYFNEYHNVE